MTIEMIEQIPGDDEPEQKGRPIALSIFGGLFALLLVGALLLTVGPLQPGAVSAAGPSATITAQYMGLDCGSHLMWDQEQATIRPGTVIKFVNGTAGWEVPVLIETRDANGRRHTMAESPLLESGESWSYTFDKAGIFYVTSSRDVERYAGLDGQVKVSKT